jgi:serine phosphatase RsbU (regulator of sigma subunit)
MRVGRRNVAASVLMGLLVLIAGAWVESVLIEATHASGHELEWVSDVIAAVAVTALMYLWLDLRATRTRVLDLERAGIVVAEQLRLAAEIQRMLLPRIPAATPGYEWAARMIPAHEIGGDFYDFIERDDAVVLILGDVSGKGIPAALLQSSLKTLFRVHAATTDAPDAIATGMSDGLREQTGGLPYATVILARIEQSPRRITYVNAGHPAGLVANGHGIAELTVGGPPLGLLAGAAYQCGAVDLAPGDLGVLVTDGVTEALDGGAAALRAAVASESLRRLAPPGTVCDQLLRIAGEGHGPLEAGGWSDDRTALAFRVVG